MMAMARPWNHSGAVPTQIKSQAKLSGERGDAVTSWRSHLEDPGCPSSQKEGGSSSQPWSQPPRKLHRGSSLSRIMENGRRGPLAKGNRRPSYSWVLALSGLWMEQFGATCGCQALCRLESQKGENTQPFCGLKKQQASISHLSSRVWSLYYLG